ncbi:hypothetical protein VFPFJ_05598 [Purpureocillium lilacinum]|uniref:Uncharacterized protein n=1 Tax=Purpureocillium lilacinum TaxID=33203 RepID=A0A179H4I5_PURLI|nr:hypothetical protein VFPFJ_05598 [Purpureocillium lilacinum]OAQ84648.1 hypothetical protein VFPBJ_03416 [Purpureocillium lilacinum]OAQ89189.1 hypothetical protein VFPFJ_05598 [Purpureocillium lilacinum]
MTEGGSGESAQEGCQDWRGSHDGRSAMLEEKRNSSRFQEGNSNSPCARICLSFDGCRVSFPKRARQREDGSGDERTARRGSQVHAQKWPSPTMMRPDADTASEEAAAEAEAGGCLPLMCQLM